MKSIKISKSRSEATKLVALLLSTTLLVGCNASSPSHTEILDEMHRNCAIPIGIEYHASTFSRTVVIKCDRTNIAEKK